MPRGPARPLSQPSMSAALCVAGFRLRVYPTAPPHWRCNYSFTALRPRLHSARTIPLCQCYDTVIPLDIFSRPSPHSSTLPFICSLSPAHLTRGHCQWHGQEAGELEAGTAEIADPPDGPARGAGAACLPLRSVLRRRGRRLGLGWGRCRCTCRGGRPRRLPSGRSQTVAQLCRHEKAVALASCEKSQQY